jgi:SpoVK/Ycf46/Vps4 family AAA+-type ATPase
MAPCFLLLDNIEIVLGGNGNNSRDDTSLSNDEDSDDSDDDYSSRTSHKALDRVLSTLLVEIDGVTTISDSSQSWRRVIVLATTSNPKVLDRTLLRPGRLELHIKLDLPNENQRKDILVNMISQIIKRHTNDKSLILSPGINTLADRIAKKTVGKSPAELKLIIQEATIDVIRELVKYQEEERLQYININNNNEKNEIDLNNLIIPSSEHLLTFLSKHLSKNKFF